MNGGPPLSYLTGSGSRSADSLQTLAWGFLAICAAVVVIVAVLILLAIRRSRTRAATSDIGDVGREDGGLALIWWGVGLALPVLLAMALWNFLVTRSLAAVPSAPALTVKITAHRWWWEVRYQDAGGRAVTSANELVLPVGVPVRLQLASGDVIHDFWVPKLGPKMDMIPGRTNQTWLEADRPGVYRGQCAEFCGLEHARMGFVVRAVAPAQFAQWLAHERQPAADTAAPWDLAAPSPDAAATAAASPVPSGAAMPAASPMIDTISDQVLFQGRCGTCHAVRGTGAGGILGPDLTHFGSRPTIAAGMLTNNPGNLERWIAAPQVVKPGVLMPQVQLEPFERARMVRYLERLK